MNNQTEALTRIILESGERSILNIKEANKMLWTEEETRIENERTEEQLRRLEEALSKDEEKGDSY